MTRAINKSIFQMKYSCIIKIALGILLLFSSWSVQAQSKFKIGKNQYRIESKRIANDWNTKDELKEPYLVNKSKKEKVLSYYAYKDEGGDCNNLFWNKAMLKIKSDTLIIKVQHFQKTGLDPITEWEKITYRINADGKAEVIAHLYKMFGSNEWKPEEEWYR